MIFYEKRQQHLLYFILLGDFDVNVGELINCALFLVSQSTIIISKSYGAYSNLNESYWEGLTVTEHFNFTRH